MKTSNTQDKALQSETVPQENQTAKHPSSHDDDERLHRSNASKEHNGWHDTKRIMKESAISHDLDARFKRDEGRLLSETCESSRVQVLERTQGVWCLDDCFDSDDCDNAGE